MLGIRIRAIKAKIKKYSLMKLLDNSFIVKKFYPPKDSESYELVRDKLKRINLDKTPERLATYKVFIMVAIFIICIVVNLNYIKSKDNEIINGNEALGIMDIGSALDQNSADKLYSSIMKKTISICPDYKKLLKQERYQEVVNYIIQAEKEMYINDPKGELTKSVFDRFILISYNRIELRNIFIYMLIAFMATKIIDIYISVSNNIRENEIYNEFKVLELSTMVLIKNTEISTERVLRIQYEHCKILKPYYHKCLSKYPVNKEKAIQDLMDDVSNEQFTEFMSMILDNFKGDRETNNRLIEANKNLGYELDDEAQKERLTGIGRIFTYISFPNWIVAILILFIPILIKIKTQL